MYFLPDVEENLFIAPPDLKRTNLCFLPEKNILSRLGKNFKEIFSKKLDYILIFPIQLISIATSIIPFMEHDDGNRALMGSNMQRQAVPLMEKERAFVRTGLESRIISDIGHSLQAKITGYISYTGGGSITIQKGFCNDFQYKTAGNKFKLNNFLLKKKLSPYKKNLFNLNDSKKKFKISISFFYNFFSSLFVFFSIYETSVYYPVVRNLKLIGNLENIKKKKIFGTRGEKKKNFFIRKKEFLLQFQRSNQETILNHKNVLSERNWVQKGDLLADGSGSEKGDLAIGKNLLIAYMPWHGYNFEDAILINERLIYNDIFTSIHIERFETEIKKTNDGFEEFTRIIPDIDFSKVLHLDENGIIKIGSFVKEGDILVGKITPINRKPLLPHEKLFYDILEIKIPTTKDSSLRVPKGVEGKIIDIQLLETSLSKGIFEKPKKLQIFIAEKRKIQVGDKISGRHGNKGIISKILPKQDMPYLPDGTAVDIVLNPLGVPSRMNVGQVFECLFGLAAKELKEEYKIIPFDEMFGVETSRSIVFSKLYTSFLKTKKAWLFNPNYPGKIKLFDGFSGNPFNQHVTTGYSYILKLIHLVDEKIHARSTGPYSLVTQQPLRGRSKHGGQRVGEMEVWALEGFGATYILQELLTIKSDDMKGRRGIFRRILNKKPIFFGTPESFKVLIRELQSLCLKITGFQFKEKKLRKNYGKNKKKKNFF